MARVPEVLGWCAEAGIKIITFYMLSTTNLNRTPGEKMTPLAEELLNRLASAGTFRLRPIGAWECLPASTVAAVNAAVDSTKDTQGLLVNLALGYSGREDILRALQAVLRDPACESLRPGQVADQLTLDAIEQNLSTAGQPDPDLIIRTSGEIRTSGFLTWQAEQAELYFTDRLWPEFSRQDLAQALASFTERHRRYGL